jgi:hypothetical protein
VGQVVVSIGIAPELHETLEAAVGQYWLDRAPGNSSDWTELQSTVVIGQSSSQQWLLYRAPVSSSYWTELQKSRLLVAVPYRVGRCTVSQVSLHQWRGDSLGTHEVEHLPLEPSTRRTMKDSRPRGPGACVNC